MMTSRKSAQCNLFQIDEIPEWSDCFYEWKYCGRCFCECYKIHQSKTVFNRFTTNRQIPCTFWHPFVCRFMRTHSHWVPPSNASNQVRIKYPLNAKKLHVHVHCSLFSKALKKKLCTCIRYSIWHCEYESLHRKCNNHYCRLEPNWITLMK